MSNERRILYIADVEYRTGLHRSTILRAYKVGRFPRPRYAGTLRFWPEEEVADWINNLPSSPTTPITKPLPT